MSNTPKEEKARILGQLYGIYKNTNVLLTPSINQIEFEKSVTDEKIDFYPEEVIKGFTADLQVAIETEKDEAKTVELIKSTQDLKRLEVVNVMFDNVVKSVYVDLIDTETNTYKDNSLNRKFNRVGQAVKL